MSRIRSFLYLLLAFGCTSCFDLNPGKTTIYEGYYVSDDAAEPFKTLYLEVKPGYSVERCQNVTRVGYKQGYIFIEAPSGNYWFAVQDDKGWNSLDPAAALLLNGPLTTADYQQALKRLAVGEVAFQFP
jgi:hypothetical protein